MSHFRILGVSLLACSAGLVAWLSPAGTGTARAAGKGGTCTADIPLQWEILDKYVDGITVNAIQDDRAVLSDPPRPYVNGQQDVQSQVAVCNGSGRASVYVRFSSSGPRQAFVSFANLLAPTTYTPSWTAGAPVGCAGQNQCWLFWIGNVLFLPAGNDRADEYEFTSIMGGHGPLYSKLSLFNPGGDVTQPPDMFTAVANDPTPNSLIRVHHCPAAFTGTSDFCTGGQKEQWFAWPEVVPKPIGTLSAPPAATQVATLILNGMKKPSGPLNGGEFSIPFLFKFTALQ